MFSRKALRAPVRVLASYDWEWFFVSAQYLHVQSAVSFSIAAM
jgi:hypothetical protein